MIQQSRKRLERFGVVALVALTLVTISHASAQDLGKQTQDLFKAVQADDLKAAKIAVGSGANLYAQNSKGRTAIDLAIDLGNFYLVQYLLDERDKLDESGQAQPVQKIITPAPEQAVVKYDRHEVAALPRPPAYPPSKPKPLPVQAPPVQAPPVLVQVPAPPKQKVQEVQEAPKAAKDIEQQVSVLPDFKPIEFDLNQYVKPAPIKVEKPTPVVKVASIQKVEETIPAGSVVEPIVEPVVAPEPLVTFAPKTKGKLNPIRTFFLKTMPKAEQPRANLNKSGLASKRKRKIQKPPRKRQVPLGTVKPADEGNVMVAPDFPTLPIREAKTKIEAALSKTVCGKKNAQDLGGNMIENSSRTLVLDLPPVAGEPCPKE